MIIKRFYADILNTRDVICVLHMDDPEEGPPTPPIYEGVEYQYLGTSFVWDAPSDTCKPTWPVGATAIVWVETSSLGTLVNKGLIAIDAAANAARAAVLTEPTNTEEYHRAADQARPFKDAGYPAGAVPRSVAAWASAKYRDNWTAQMAADDVIATADAWLGKLDDIRDLRLHAKEDVRHAADGPAIDAIVVKFKTDLSTTMEA